MHLHWIDWAIIGLILLPIAWMTITTRKYVRGAADFLAANRLAGRYLLTVSQGIGGVISIVAGFEMLYAAGLPTQWWSMMALPVGLILSLTGFVTYRFRQTRALTLAQFLEMRYSRSFRFYAGLISWLSGILNYGIFPMVTARMLIHLMGLPDYWSLGSWDIPMYPTVMAAYLSFTLFTILTGGQISIMITDFYEGILTLVILVILGAFLLYQFSWFDITAGLALAPEGKSMINPFKTGHVEDFNIWYFLIGIFGSIYARGSWQGSSGYAAAARTPHEAKMAGILGSWRGFGKALVFLLIPLAAYAVMHHPKFAELAAPIQNEINALSGDAQLQKQMTVPLFLNYILPVGLMGLFASIIICAAINCDNTYLHSWGTIFVQDVLMPLRRSDKPLNPNLHMWIMRWSIIGVAVFAFIWSMYFPLQQYILMYFAITGAIFTGGAGAVILGGLYWKRGTTAGAWVAMTLGTIIGFGGLMVINTWTWLNPILQSWFPHVQWFVVHAKKFPINGQWMMFYAMLVSAGSYIIVSLLGGKVFNMDKMLHRGKYAVASDVVVGEQKARKSWKEMLGLNREFTKGDRILFWASFWWSMGWWGIFLTGTTLNLWGFNGDHGWTIFWGFKIYLTFLLAIVLLFWFLWGGVRDAVHLMRDLRNVHRDASDDGIVRKDKEPDADGQPVATVDQK